MRHVLLTCGWMITLLLAGCAQPLHREQRVIELPRTAPNATLSTAARIGQEIIGADFFAAVQRQFPTLTPEQFQGVFLSWREGVIDGKPAVFFLTGVRYKGAMAESKAVADYCQTLVKAAVDAAFPDEGSK